MAKAGFSSPAQQRLADSVNNKLNILVKQGRMQPVPLTGLQASSDIMTRGAQVSFQVTSLQGVDSFVLLRNFSRDPGSAQQIHVWSAAALVSTPQTYPLNLQYMDADPAIAGKVAYYWVKAVPASNATTSNTFLSGPQEFDASDMPSAAQIAGDFATYQAYTPTTSPLTSTTGGPVNQATITVAPFQIQYPFDADGDGSPDLISYNGGSITPLLDATTYFVYFDDPKYAGGAQTFIASTDETSPVQSLHRQFVGSITTPAHGGGGTGGGGGGNGPCFSGNTLIVTKRGHVPIEEIEPGDRVYSKIGWRTVKARLVHDFDGIMQEMGSGELVTPRHGIWTTAKKGFSGEWVPAESLFPMALHFKGLVYNLALGASKARNKYGNCYLLKNGWYASNVQKL
jgi:hypothetical protein